MNVLTYFGTILFLIFMVLLSINKIRNKKNEAESMTGEYITLMVSVLWLITFLKGCG